MGFCVFLHLGFCFSVEVEPHGGFHSVLMVMFSPGEKGGHPLNLCGLKLGGGSKPKLHLLLPSEVYFPDEFCVCPLPTAAGRRVSWEVPLQRF